MYETTIHGEAPIPPFEADGNLPVGVHLANIDEVVDRFSRSKDGRCPFARLLKEMHEAALSAGIHKIILAGSFVTQEQRICRDLDGFFYGPETADWPKLKKYCFNPNDRSPEIRSDFFIATSTKSYRHFVQLFQSTRSGSTRGLVEISVLSSVSASTNFNPFLLDSMIEHQIATIQSKLHTDCSLFEREFFEARLAELQENREKFAVHDFYKQCLLTEVSSPGSSGEGDIQVNSLIGLIMERTPICIVDYGCAKGRLVSELDTLDTGFLKGLTYLGFDFRPEQMEPILAETRFREKCAACEVAEYSKVSENANVADCVFLVNVLHEVPLASLYGVLSQALSLAKAGGLLVFHDLEHVVFGESSFLPWQGEDIKEILVKLGMRCTLRKHKSKNGAPLYTVIVHIDENARISPQLLSETVKATLSARIDALIAERKSVMEGSQNEREYAYFSVSIANAIAQLRGAESNR